MTVNTSSPTWLNVNRIKGKTNGNKCYSSLVTQVKGKPRVNLSFLPVLGTVQVLGHPEQLLVDYKFNSNDPKLNYSLLARP